MKYIDLQERRRYAFENVIPNLFKAGFEDKAKHISMCSNWKEIAVCQDCGDQYMNGFTTCKERLCPICEKQRSLLWLARLMPVCQELISQKFNIQLMTLTIPDTKSLKEGLSNIYQTWRYFSNGNKRMRKEFKNRFAGGIRFFEVKRGFGSNDWHCHFHCLIAKNNNTRDFEWLLNNWSIAYNLVSKTNIKCNVDIRLIKKKNVNESLLTAVLETCKYVSKFDWRLENDVFELVRGLRGLRTTSAWGVFKEVLKETDVEKDMSKSLSETMDLVCSSCGSKAFEIIDGISSKHLRINEFEKE